MGRSTAYPVHNLKEAIGRLESLMKNIGFGPFSRETAVNGMGYKGLSGSAGRSFSALQQYGLIARISNDSYRISEIGKRILHPVSKDDRKAALLAASGSPKIYERLNDLFVEGSIPEKLDNYLINQPEFLFTNKKAAAEVAANYKANFEFLGLAQQGQASNLTDDSPVNNGEGNSDINRQLHQQNSSEGMASPRTLPSGIVIIFPLKLDALVTFGDFGKQLRALDERAAELLGGNGNDETEDSD